jgi:hypothetical protein
VKFKDFLHTAADVCLRFTAASDARHLGGGSLHFTCGASGNGIDICFIISGASHLTATVAVLGLLPASLSTGIGSDVQRPLATIIVYGLLCGTILTLYVLPAFYYMLEKRSLKWE